TIPAIYLSLMMTGHFLPQIGFVGEHTASGLPLLEKLNQVVSDLGFQDYTQDVSNKWNMFLFTLTLMVGTAGLPHVIIRFFTVPNIQDARWSRSEEHTSELQSRENLVCRLLPENKKGGN